MSTASGDYCERNANAGQEGVTCYAGMTGKIKATLAGHEMGHVFNALVSNNGYSADDPYDDLSAARASNPQFPPIDAGITDGYLSNSGSNGEDFANTFSMQLFGAYPSTIYGREREGFMARNMILWILRMLYP